MCKKNKWSEILVDPGCGGYYSDNPCLAKTCNPRHRYCPKHQIEKDRIIKETTKYIGPKIKI